MEQLGSDKLEVRLGGIYSLERISKESPDDYWTVMENLTAFVRERSRRNEAERTSRTSSNGYRAAPISCGRRLAGQTGGLMTFGLTAAREEELGEPPATDIAAVLTVIKRRSEQSREREGANDWRFDLSGAILKRCDLSGAHLEWANLNDAHLEGANLSVAHLEGASLWDAHLEGAFSLARISRGPTSAARILSGPTSQRASRGAPSGGRPQGRNGPIGGTAPRRPRRRHDETSRRDALADALAG